MGILAGRLTRAMRADVADNEARIISLAGEHFSQSAVEEVGIYDCAENGAGTCRNSDYIDALTARADAAEATIDAIRTALNGYSDSDLVSLATSLNARNEALEAENERMNRLPQMISDAVWQYAERDEDGYIDPNDVSGIIAKIAGDGSVSDDSLWFTGEQWADVVGKLDDAVAEVTRLREWIIEASSAYRLDGGTDTLDEAVSLVRMCHEGREAIDEAARLTAQVAELTTCDCGKRLSRGLCRICDNDE